MKQPHRTENTNNMKNIVKRGSLALLGAGLALSNACTEPVVCGAGTRLDAETNECRSAGPGPDLNVIVDDFSIGNFSFTQADIPEQMIAGYPEDRTFTLTNTGEEAQAVTLVRVHLVAVNTVIEELRDAIADIGSEPGCEAEADCSASTDCNVDEQLCKLAPVNIGAVIIENLAAGEARPITYSLALPQAFEGTGVYGLMFSVNEVALVPNPTLEGTFIEDPEHPLGIEDPFARAAGLFAPATVILGAVDKPNLRILSGTLDNSSFTTDSGETPIMTVSHTISAQGKNITSPVHTRFELSLPGYQIDAAGQDQGEQFFLDLAVNLDTDTANDVAFADAAAETTYVYNEERTFNLLVRGASGEFLSQADALPECANDACTEQISVQNDLGRDGVFALHLSAVDRRTLALTAAFDIDDAARELLDDNLEAAGILRMIVSTDEPEYEVDGAELLADNVRLFDVAFLAPEAGRDATDTDLDVLPDSGSDQATLYPGPGPYPESDNLTPTWYWSVGNEWLGAEAQILNTTSTQRQFTTLVAKDVVSANFVRLNGLKQTFDIVNVSANVDFGTRRGLTENRASGRLALFGTTYLDFSFAPGVQCQITEPNFESCLIFEGEARPRTNEGPPTTTKRNKKKFYVNYSRSKRTFFFAGPLPFEIEVGVNAGLGMRAAIAFVQDRRDSADGGATNSIINGLQVTVGPVADAGGSAFGGLSLGLVRVGIRGTVTFVSAEFQPAVLIGLQQEADEANNCWKVNGGVVRFEGPLTLTVLSGSIDVVAEGGICGCLPWVGCACAWGDIFSFNIIRINPAYSATWQLFENTVNISTGSGVCANAPPPPTASASETWNSPIGCRSWSGANAYCDNANGTGTYTKTFAKSGCGALTINGLTERNYDYVTVRDGNGTQLIRESGTFTNRVVNVCGNASVTLTTDYSVVESGITVLSN